MCSLHTDQLSSNPGPNSRRESTEKIEDGICSFRSHFLSFFPFSLSSLFVSSPFLFLFLFFHSFLFSRFFLLISFLMSLRLYVSVDLAYIPTFLMSFFFLSLFLSLSVPCFLWSYTLSLSLSLSLSACFTVSCMPCSSPPDVPFSKRLHLDRPFTQH